MKSLEIESQKNTTFRELRDLLTRQGIEESGLALIFGRKAIHDTLSYGPQEAEAAIVGKNMALGFSARKTIILSPKLFDELDVFGTQYPMALVKVPRIKEISEAKLEGCTLLIPFQDPQNVGGVLRSAAGFGVKNIILAPGSAHPFHPRSVRAASGTLFLFDYYSCNDWNSLPGPKIALDKRGKDVARFEFPKDFILVPGLEGKGLSEIQIKEADDLVSIPISNQVESLNAMVATSLVLFSWKIRQNKIF